MGLTRSPARLTRRRTEALEVGARDRAYDTPLLGGILGRRDPHKDLRTPATTARELSAADAAAAAEALTFGGEARRPQRGGWHRAGVPAADGHAAERRRRGRSAGGQPKKPEQLTLAAVTDGSYTLPPVALLKPGTVHRARTRANDTMVEALSAVLEQFEVDAQVDRLHQGPDRDPVRDRAGARGQGRAGHPAVEEHRLRGQERRRPDPVPDPRQVGDRGRDPQRRPRHRQPRRRAAVPGGDD